MFTKHILVLCSAILLLSLMAPTTPAFGNDWWTPRTVPTDFYNYQDEWVGGNGDWCNPNNWLIIRSATARPPGPNTCAEISPIPPGPNILGNCPGIDFSPPICARLDVMPWSWPGAGNIDCNIAPTAGLVDCGVVIAICGGSAFDSSTQGHGILNVYGGTMFTPATSAYWGDANGLWIGGSSSRIAACYGVVNMYDGLISVPRVAIYNGVINLYGGVIEQTHNTSADLIIPTRYARNTINITNGTLLLEGDRSAEIAPYIADGRIRACDNRGFSRIITSYASGVTTVTAFCDWESAWNPNPPDNWMEVYPQPTLTWAQGDYVQDTNKHQVYLGTSFNDVNNATPDNPLDVYKGTRDVNNYTPAGELQWWTYYYWRIDEVNTADSNSPWKGKVWHFATMIPPYKNPYPPRDSNIGFDVNKLYMSWNKVPTVTTHDIYFGTDYNSVRNANTSTPVIYRGQRTDANYPLSALSPDYTLVSESDYYWRVDDINNANPHSPWIDEVWHFVFPNNYIIDNFNSYVSATDMNTVWKTNKVTGLCPGGGHMNPGGTLILDPYNGVGYTQAMILDYNNTGHYYDRFSEARHEEPNSGTDWTIPTVPSGTPKLLYIAYKGLADNNADPCLDRMYVAIADSCCMALKRIGPVIYNPDPNAQRQTTWRDWYIKLSDLSHDPNPGGTPTDVNLHKIRYVYVGLGLRCNVYGSSGIPGGGTGKVTFDNVWITQPLCLPEYRVAADFTGDCEVDMDDLNVMNKDWLEAGSIADIYPEDNPDGIVDFRDFAIMAQEWLTEQFP